MQVIQTDIEGVVILQPRIFGHERGYFLSRFHNGVLSSRFVRRFLCRIMNRNLAMVY